MIKRYLVLLVAGAMISTSFYSCKAMARGAAKLWVRKKRKAWVKKCNESAIGKLGGEKSEDFCDCALDLVIKKYPNPDDGMALKFVEILKMANECAGGGLGGFLGGGK